MGTHAANGSICSSDLMVAGAGTFSSAILSAQGYQQRQADMTYILMLDENTDMLRLIMVRISPCWSRISDEDKQVNKSRMGVNEVLLGLKRLHGFLEVTTAKSKFLKDDLEANGGEKFLKWQLSLLSVRAKKYYQRTGKKIFINSNDIARYDKSKVECYNCHKLGYFARECRAPRSKECQFRNQDNTRKQGNNEDISSKAMLAIDGVGQVNTVRVKGVNAIKSSAYWFWRPTKPNGASLAFKRHNYIDERGKSKASYNMMIKDLLTVDAQGIASKHIKRERAATTASSLEAEQDSGNIKFEITSEQSNDPPLSRGYTLGSGEDSMELLELMEFFNPIIYTSCIKQFWATAKVQTVYRVRQCTRSKSCSMASLIICLATNQKFNLSKYIFDAMVKHLDGGVKFLMYLNVILTTVKDFSGRITPLFDTMMVQAFEEVGEDSDHPTDSTQIPIINQPSTSSKPKKKQPSKKTQRQETEVSQDEIDHEESVLDLEKAKDAQAKKIAALKKKVQKLERKKTSRTTGLKRLKKVGRSIADIDADVEVTLVDETQDRQDDELMFDTGVLDTDDMPVEAKVDEKDEQSTKLDDSTVGEAVTTASVENSVAPTTIEEITLAQTLIQIKAAKPKVVTTAATTTTTTRPKAKGVVVQEPSEFRVPQEAQPLISKDKGKGIMIEPGVPLKRKDQIALDEQIARDVQAKLDAELIEEQKLARKQEEEANIALIESWENTQAMMEADRLLAERLQSKEREELTDEEKGKLFMELMEKRRKHFAALRAQEKRNRPPTKAQKRTQMSTYLKHMGGYTYKQLKGKSFDEIQKLFDKEMKRVNTFVAMGSEVQESKEKKVEGSEETAKGSRKKMLGRKRAGKEQQQESSKKQRMEEDKESDEVEEVSEDDEGELMKHLVIKKDEDIAIDAIPLATKLPVIIDYKLHKEGMVGTLSVDTSRWKFQEILFNDKDATRNRQRRLRAL
ncbi:ribonuclease H-like domain, reverse transcriptase, RNA-dependent DNA polymerase [Tanacetum coccineum]